LGLSGKSRGLLREFFGGFTKVEKNGASETKWRLSGGEPGPKELGIGPLGGA